MDRSKLPKLTEEQLDEFRKAIVLSPDLATETLRNLAVRFSKNGMKREDVYRHFLSFDLILEDEKETEKVALLEDVMDMICDSFRSSSPWNLHLPK
jgi:hypothetical protein